jgi:hypothetical protein
MCMSAYLCGWMGAEVDMSAHDHDVGWAAVGAPGVYASRQPSAWQGARATHGVVAGVWLWHVHTYTRSDAERGGWRGGAGKGCFEVTMRGQGLCRVGWATATASLSLGTDGQGFGYGGTGKKSVGGKFDDYGEAYGDGDIITCALDRTDGTVSYFKNGGSLTGKKVG